LTLKRFAVHARVVDVRGAVHDAVSTTFGYLPGLPLEITSHDDGEVVLYVNAPSKGAAERALMAVAVDRDAPFSFEILDVAYCGHARTSS